MTTDYVPAKIITAKHGQFFVSQHIFYKRIFRKAESCHLVIIFNRNSDRLYQLQTKYVKNTYLQDDN